MVSVEVKDYQFIIGPQLAFKITRGKISYGPNPRTFYSGQGSCREGRWLGRQLADEVDAGCNAAARVLVRVGGESMMRLLKVVVGIIGQEERLYAMLRAAETDDQQNRGG